MILRQRLVISVIFAIVLACSGGFAQAAGDSRGAGKKATASQQTKLSPKQAASKAKARYGGKVLKVTPAGAGYKVRLLQDSGRVITVTIGS
ncbi:MAG: hypothetical protein Hals2KO_10960 [Halioglobus sp.]